jgi:hypothetical protein
MCVGKKKKKKIVGMKFVFIRESIEIIECYYYSKTVIIIITRFKAFKEQNNYSINLFSIPKDTQAIDLYMLIISNRFFFYFKFDVRALVLAFQSVKKKKKLLNLQI